MLSDEILEAATILMSISQQKQTTKWQTENGGHIYYRESVLKGIKNVLRKRAMIQLDVIVSEVTIDTIALNMELFHFKESANLSEYMNAKLLMERIDSFQNCMNTKKNFHK